MTNGVAPRAGAWIETLLVQEKRLNPFILLSEKTELDTLLIRFNDYLD